MQKQLKLALGILSLFLSVTMYGQTDGFIKTDTIRLNVDSVERIFLHNNLLLLAQHYNVDAQKALVAQAKLFPNPNLNLNTAVYQTDMQKFFPFGKDGEVQFGLSQVILLAGKYNKQIKLAMTNASISEYQFEDVLRTLKSTLQSDFYNLYFLQKSASVYAAEINALKKVSDAFELQKGKGYVSEKEVIRIKAQLYSLLSEYNDLIAQINDLQSALLSI